MQRNKPFLRHIPPTAVPVKGSDIWHGLTASINGKDSIQEFKSALMEGTGSTNCYPVSSGRAGLSIILLSLKRLSGQRRVVVPAYVCPTVVQSVLKAGLEPVFCDVSPQTLDLDRDGLSKLIDGNLLALVPAHLYGWAQDVRDLVTMGKQHGFFVVEDAAQAYGAKIHGRMVGTWGDAGYFSLGRGKCIPVGHGGVIVAKDQLADTISAVIEAEATPPARIDISSVPLFAGYGIATHPIGWWIITRTPKNPADEGMDIEELHPVTIGGLSSAQAGIGISILRRLEQHQAVCIQNAGRLMDLLSNYDFVSVPQIAPEAEPIFLRLPFIVSDEQHSIQVYNQLQKEGIGVSRSYWRTIPDLFSSKFTSNEKDFPGAEHLAKCLLTLPTHPYLNEGDFERISATFEAVAKYY